jgi:hypothetical protein
VRGCGRGDAGVNFFMCAESLTAGKGFGWAPKDNGLRASCLDSSHVHQSKVAMTRIARVATRGSSTYYLANKVLVTSVDFWFRVMGQNIIPLLGPRDMLKSEN